MPLEIKEIVVTASLTEKGGNASTISGSETSVVGINKEEIIADCVEQILEILREKNEP